MVSSHEIPTPTTSSRSGVRRNSEQKKTRETAPDKPVLQAGETDLCANAGDWSLLCRRDEVLSNNYSDSPSDFKTQRDVTGLFVTLFFLRHCN